MEFKKHFFVESRAYLGQKIGDVLTLLQNLQEDAPNLGNRQLISSLENVVNEIRRILHDNWADSDINKLKILQKSGVAIMKAIESNQNLVEILGSVIKELEKATKDVTINNLASQE